VVSCGHGIAKLAGALRCHAMPCHGRELRARLEKDSHSLDSTRWIPSIIRVMRYAGIRLMICTVGHDEGEAQRHSTDSTWLRFKSGLSFLSRKMHSESVAWRFINKTAMGNIENINSIKPINQTQLESNRPDSTHLNPA
jgi:hypothetical protein